MQQVVDEGGPAATDFEGADHATINAASSDEAGRGRVSQNLLRVVKFAVSLGFWCLSEARRILVRLSGRVPPPIATVIYYHQVLPHERQRFARQLDHLCKWAKPIPADLYGLVPCATPYVSVTFDDGWSSFAEIAFPELRERKIPVTLFVVAGRLGRRLEPFTDEPLITAAQLEWLAASGVTIGSHTLTHCLLPTVDEATALYELRESRRVLSGMLEREVTLFAFPFGQSDSRLIPLCSDAGYQRVFTGLPHLAFSRPGEFETGRIRVDPSDWPLEFYLKLMGAYRWLPAAIALKSRLRRATRRVIGRFDR